MYEVVVKKYLLLAIVVCMSLFSILAMASEENEKVYLVQIINQLDAIKPLIIAAKNEQAKNIRVQFHYTAFRDSNGKLHNGLLEDIAEIKKVLKKN